MHVSSFIPAGAYERLDMLQRQNIKVANIAPNNNAGSGTGTDENVRIRLPPVLDRLKLLLKIPLAKPVVSMIMLFGSRADTDEYDAMTHERFCVGSKSFNNPGVPELFNDTIRNVALLVADRDDRSSVEPLSPTRLSKSTPTAAFGLNDLNSHT
jgi:hypothetical protein